MSRWISFVLRLYYDLLRLYPRGFRDEFADEMCVVFSEALTEAADRGVDAVFALVLREVCDLPKSILSACLRERGELTMQPPIETEKRMGWLQVLIGILPLILLGPLQAMMPYASQDFRAWLNIGSDQVMIGFLLLMAVGTTAGLIQRFPRWSYPYLIALAMFLLVNVVARITLLLPQERFLVGSHLVMLFVFFVILTAIVVLIARSLKPFHRLYQSIRQDWTQLSFGLLSYVAFATGFNGGDHPPPFGMSVLLPSTIVVIGALAHLLSVNRWQRILSLLIALTLLPIVIPSGAEEVPAWSALLFLLAVVFLPALFEHLPRDKTSAAA